MNIKALLKALLLRKFNTGLLILQLAITLGLIVNSSILSLDTANKLAMDTGMNLTDTLAVEFRTTSGDYRDLDFARSIQAQDIASLKQIPGVIAVSPINQLPIQNGGSNGNVYDEDDPDSGKRDRMLNFVQTNFVDDGIGQALGLTLVEGRMLTDADKPDATAEGQKLGILITEALSKALHGDQSSVGQELNRGIVVGVVKNVMVYPHVDADKQYAIYSNSAQQKVSEIDTYLIKTEAGQAEYVRKRVADVMLGVEPQRDIRIVKTMQEHFENYYKNNTGLANLFIMLTLLMLLVTAISSFAYARFHISQQTKYIGIRRALGAKKSDVILYVLAENWLLTSLGVVLGLALMMGLNILLSQYVSLTKPTWLLALSGIVLVFTAGTIATWWPAYQTSKIAPVIATRSI